MPTTVTNTYTDSVGTPSQQPERASMERFQVTASTTLDPGTGKKFIAVAIVTATGKLGIYADAGAGGLGVFRGLCPVKAVAAADGKITINNGNFLGQTEDTIAVYTAGYFLTAEITGLDAAAMADVAGHLVWGDYTTGEVYIPG